MSDKVVVVWLSMEWQKYLHLCFEDKWKSYEFGTTWGWVLDDHFL